MFGEIAQRVPLYDASKAWPALQLLKQHLINGLKTASGKLSGKSKRGVPAKKWQALLEDMRLRARPSIGSRLRGQFLAQLLRHLEDKGFSFAVLF
jgi:uncharacterized protein YgfB (UPF0149 family)